MQTDSNEKSDPNIDENEKTLRGIDIGVDNEKKSSFVNSEKMFDTKKIFNCEYCELNFDRSVKLKIHVRIHTREKPFKCQHCESSFNQKGHLKKHERIHTGEKPFKCQHCESSFNQI